MLIGTCAAVLVVVALRRGVTSRRRAGGRSSGYGWIPSDISQQGGAGWVEPSGAKVWIQGASGAWQNIAAGASEWVDWNATEYNKGCTINYSGGDNSSTNYIQVPSDGLYYIEAKIYSWTGAPANGNIQLEIVNVGTSALYGTVIHTVPAGLSSSAAVSTVVRLPASTQIGIRLAPSYACAIYAINSNGAHLNSFVVQRIGPYA